GSMPYSLVTQPLPLPFKKGGTPSSTVAVQITRVLPSSISTLPSAVEMKSGVILSGRIWSAARPSLLTAPPVPGSLTCSPLSEFSSPLGQFDGREAQCQRRDKEGARLGCGRARCGICGGGARGGIHSKRSRQIDVARQRLHFLPMNEDFQPFQLRHIRF